MRNKFVSKVAHGFHFSRKAHSAVSICKTPAKNDIDSMLEKGGFVTIYTLDHVFREWIDSLTIQNFLDFPQTP